MLLSLVLYGINVPLGKSLIFCCPNWTFLHQIQRKKVILLYLSNWFCFPPWAGYQSACVEVKLRAHQQVWVGWTWASWKTWGPPFLKVTVNSLRKPAPRFLPIAPCLRLRRCADTTQKKKVKCPSLWDLRPNSVSLLRCRWWFRPTETRCFSFRISVLLRVSVLWI